MARVTRRGKRFGRWKLTGSLDYGGNAAVWLGVDQEGERAAIKILNKGRWRGESYTRFKDEVALMRMLAGRRGVMPILGHSTPDKPSATETPWHAMPVAAPMHKEFGSADTAEDRVSAVADVALVLADLAEEKIFHRDLKPHNLFLLDAEWIVGDFGLAWFEEKSPMTETGGSLGATLYMAPEMRIDAKNADFELADVYSLAKSLWVVVSGRAEPPLGQLRPDSELRALSHHIEHPRIAGLDLLLERCTSDVPTVRPRMRVFHDELRGFAVRPQRETLGAPDLTDIGRRVVAATELERRKTREQDRVTTQFNELVQRARDLLAPMAQSVRETFGELEQAEGKGGPPGPATPLLPEGGHRASTRVQCWGWVPQKVMYHLEVAFRLDGEDVHVSAVHSVSSGTDDYRFGESYELVRLGSLLTDDALQLMIGRLEQTFEVALAKFADVMEENRA